MRWGIALQIVVITVFVPGCDAPRTNPLDPFAEGGGGVSIAGQVTSFYEP